MFGILKVMYKGLKTNAALKDFIQLHWKRKTDHDLAILFDEDGNTSAEKIRKIRYALGLIRNTPELVQELRDAHEEGDTYLGRGPDLEQRNARRPRRDLMLEPVEWNGFDRIVEAHRKWIFAILRYQSTESDESIADRLYSTPGSITAIRKKYHIKHYHILPSDYRAM